MNEDLLQYWENAVSEFEPIDIRYMIGSIDERRVFDENLGFPGIYAWIWGPRQNVVYIGKTKKNVSSRMREHLLGLLSPAYVIGEKAPDAQSPWAFNLKDESALEILRSEHAFLELMRRKHKYFNELAVIAARVEEASQSELEGLLIRKMKPMHNATHGMREEQGAARDLAILRRSDSAANLKPAAGTD